MNSTLDPWLGSGGPSDRIQNMQQELQLASGGRARLLPVTKAFGFGAVQAVREAGLFEVGESYAQELIRKYQEVDDPELSWHMVGRLQRNKVRRLARMVSVWQSVDRPELVDEIARWAPLARVFIQVNILGRPGQGGCQPREVEMLAVRCSEAGLEVVGLMGIGVEGDREGTKRSFISIDRLADQLGLAERSMGMSEDWELAVTHGSTLVRIGRALFGSRSLPR